MLHVLRFIFSSASSPSAYFVKVSALATRTPVKTARARRRCEAFSIPHEQFWWLFSLSSPPIALRRNRISTKDSSELTQKDLLIATNRNGLHSKFLVLLVESVLVEGIIVRRWVFRWNRIIYLPTNLIYTWILLRIFKYFFLKILKQFPKIIFEL